MTSSKASTLTKSLSGSLEAFRTYCQTNLLQCDTFKARIVATRGPSGTKCPQWHVDHVPVRWIQSWVGPGCDLVVGNGGINWSMINGLEENDNLLAVEDRNRVLVDDKVAKIYSAKEQEPILLVGNRWNEFSFKSKTPQDPVVHKSPSSIPFWQGRVLLTQDVVQE